MSEKMQKLKKKNKKMSKQILEHKEQLKDVIDNLHTVQSLLLTSLRANQYSSTNQMQTFENLRA